MKTIIDILIGSLCILTVFSPILIGVIGLIVTNEKGGN